MKHSPQWLLLVAPFALVGGVALHQAMSKQSVVAWCVFTGCAVACLGVLGLAGLYVWYCRHARRDSRAGAYFRDWPRELDLLLSDLSPERRALAASQLAGKAVLRNWPYRQDAVNVLANIIKSDEPEGMVLASCMGALAEFDREKAATAAWAIVANSSCSPYLRLAAILTTARTGCLQPELRNLAHDKSQTIGIRFTTLIALHSRLSVLPAEERRAAQAWFAEFAQQEREDDSIRELALCISENRDTEAILYKHVTAIQETEELRAVSLASLLNSRKPNQKTMPEAFLGVSEQMRRRVTSLLSALRPNTAEVLLRRFAGDTQS
jgi:hypothetical protein